MTAERTRLIDVALMVEKAEALPISDSVVSTVSSKKPPKEKGSWVGPRQKLLVSEWIKKNEDGTDKYPNTLDLADVVYADLIPPSFTGDQLSLRRASLAGAARTSIAGFAMRFGRVLQGAEDTKLQRVIDEIKSANPGITDDEIKSRLQIKRDSRTRRPGTVKPRPIYPPKPRNEIVEPEPIGVVKRRQRQEASLEFAHSILEKANSRGNRRRVSPYKSDSSPASAHKPMEAVVFRQSPGEIMTQTPDFDNAQFLVIATVIEKLNRNLHPADTVKLGIRLKPAEREIMIAEGKRLIKEHPELRSYFEAQSAVFATLDYFITHRIEFTKPDNDYSGLGMFLAETLNRMTSQQLRVLQIEAGVRPLK